MSQQFCPRLSEAIGSKILSLDRLFGTPSNFRLQNFAFGAFHSHISYLWREITKNLYYSSENWGCLYLKSPHMILIEPNMDEGCKIFHRFNGNSRQDFFHSTNCIVSCKFLMTKSSTYLSIKPGVSLSSLHCQCFLHYPLKRYRVIIFCLSCMRKARNKETQELQASK